jgi:hypothetical protein
MPTAERIRNNYQQVIESAALRDCDDLVSAIEDDTARCLGYEFDGAEIMAYLSEQYRLGNISHDKASRLLQAAERQMARAKVALKWTRALREPTPEVSTYVVAKLKQAYR